MTFAAFLEPFATLFGLMALGVLVARLGILDEQGVGQISALVVHVTLPAAIFVAVAGEFTRELLRSAPWVLTLGVASGALTYAVGLGIASLRSMPPEQRGVYAFAAGCTNTGFLGIPLIGALLGPAALVTAVLYDFTTTINIFTFGVAGLDHAGPRPDLRRLLRNLLNPMFLALVLGAAWALCGWSLPAVARRVLDVAGDATTPLAMMALGHMLYSGWRSTTVHTVSIGLLGIVRLLMAPALVLGAVWMLPMPTITKAVCVLQAGMPTAMLTAILAHQYGADHRLGLTAALGTTLGSLATLPALVALVLRALHVT